MKNNFCARKIRQLKYRIKLLRNRSQENDQERQKLIAKIKQLVFELKYFVSNIRLQRIIGGAAILLGLAVGPNASAQQFGKRMESPFSITQLTQVSIPALGDLDGDGDLDMLNGNYEGNYEFSENIGTPFIPDFGPPELNPFSLAGDYEYNFPALGDLDNDGDLDILAFTEEGQMTYFKNVGDQNTPLFASAPQINPFGIQIPEIFFPDLADLDNDGDLDIIAGGAYGIRYLQNSGTNENPNFEAAEINPFGLMLGSPESDYVIPTMTDIDLDGDLDILRLEYYGTFTFQENIGTPENPSFGPVQINPFGLVTIDEDNISFVTTADLDNDGDEDLVTTTYSGAIAYYELLSTVPTEEIISNNTVTIFPNPTNNLLNIKSDLQIETVEIFDIVGRSVKFENFNGNSIDVSQLETGLYLMKLKNDQAEIVVKRFEKI